MADFYFPGRVLPGQTTKATPVAQPFNNPFQKPAGAGSGILATPAVTGKVTPKATPKVTPRATPKATPKATPSTKTGDKLTAAVTPAKLTPGLTDQLTLNQIESDNKASEALRMYQAQAAQQQLQNSLATINRSAMQQYEGIAGDYASRGMLQSGGYAVDTNRAQADVTDKKTAAETAVRDFINQNKLQGTVQKGVKNGSLQEILMTLLSQFNSNNINQLGN